MSKYTAMLIDALLIGFLLFTLIHGDLARYLAFARPNPPTVPQLLMDSAGHVTANPAYARQAPA